MIKRPVYGTIHATLLALVLGMLIAGIFLLVFSDSPKEAVYYFFMGPLISLYTFGNMANIATVLMLTGAGALLAFKAGIINLGGEGQIYAGAVLSTIVAFGLTNKVPPALGLAAVLIAGAIAAALLGAVSGLLRILWNTDELLSTFLLSGAVIPIIDYALSGPLRNQSGYLLATEPVAPMFFLSKLLPPSNLNTGVFAALVAVALLFLFLYHTVWGRNLTLCGLNREFARYSGIHTGAYILLPLTVSAGFHGLAGGLWVTGTHHMSVMGFTAGLGWNGIVVALIARNHPLALIPASLLIAYIEVGSKTAMLHTEFPFELGIIVQAIFLLLITAANIRLPVFPRLVPKPAKGEV